MFFGAGIYAIYYTGSGVEIYQPISDDCGTPIYVGKAIPEGGRTGGMDLGTASTTRSLYNRLRQHAASITDAEDLDLADFRYRYLELDDIWIPLGENYLISLYKPLWNSKHLAGFGIHHPGKGREGQRRSLWDEFHPGRSLARNRTEAPRSREQIGQDVAELIADVDSKFVAEDEDDLTEDPA